MKKQLLALVFAILTLTLAGGVLAQDEKIIVIGWEQEPDVLYPLSNSTFSSLPQNFYARGVWDWNEEYEVFPILVKEIPTVENGLVTVNEAGNTVVTYHLVEDAYWSDGEQITADDALFGHRLFSDISTGTISRGNYPEVVESVEKIDDFTLVQTFSVPYPDYISDDVYLQIRYPQHILEPLLEANGGTIDGLSYFTRAENVVGYGPYVFQEWDLGNSITFVKNPLWNGVEPEIDRIILRFITETAQLRNALETGEIDFAFNFPQQLVDSYREIAGVELWNTGSVYDDALWFNVREEGTQHPALKDINVRKAIVHAINRVENTQAIIGEGTQVPYARDAVKWHPEDLPFLEYDVDLANQLLDEAGWVDSNGNGIRDKDGEELILRFYTTPAQTRVDYQLAIQADLQVVGIGTQLYQVPGPAVLFANYTNRGIQATGDYDLSIYAFSNDPITPNISVDSIGTLGIPSAERPGGQNFAGVSNARIDELIPLIASNTDPVSRLEQKHESVQILTETVYWAGLLPRPTWFALRGDLFEAETFQGNGTLSGNWFNQVEHWRLADSN